MNKEERREALLRLLQESREPISGTRLARQLGVSRQVVVQDIEILRLENGNQDILATHQGYFIPTPQPLFERVFQVCHPDAQIEDELNTIVDAGGVVEDVFVRHDAYGEIRTLLQLSSRRDVQLFSENFQAGKMAPLKKLTMDMHFHRVSAKSIAILDAIEAALQAKGYWVASDEV